MAAGVRTEPLAKPTRLDLEVPSMARRPISYLAATILLLALAMPATAANGCPAAASGFQYGAVDWEWELGDPLPAPGDDLLWDVGVAGGAAEGLSVEDLAAIFGVATVDELYEGVLAGWRQLDKNMDGGVCFRPFPDQGQGFPAYFSNFVDTNARTAR
jgi:hypothetical protein